MDLSGKMIIDNIYFLAKENKIKIGDLESFAGVSAGYLSKLAKDETKTIPGTEILYKISKKLGVLLDTLLSVDLSTMDSTEIYFMCFLDTLIEKTDAMKIDWERISSSEIERNKIKHPLYRYNSRNEYVYTSLFYDNTENICSYPVNSIAYYKYQDIMFFLVPVNLFNERNHENNYGYEMYMLKNNVVKKICSTTFKYSIINTKLNDLYTSVISYISKPKIDEDTKATIDLFMNEFSD